jgi:hypothetical protein
MLTHPTLDQLLQMRLNGMAFRGLSRPHWGHGHPFPFHRLAGTRYQRRFRLFADLELAHGDGRFVRLFRSLVKPACSSPTIGARTA